MAHTICTPVARLRALPSSAYGPDYANHGTISDDVAREIRRECDAGRPRAALAAYGRAIGVETQRLDRRDGASIHYANRGDPYRTTLLYDDSMGRVWVGTWGDLVERGRGSRGFDGAEDPDAGWPRESITGRVVEIPSVAGRFLRVRESERTEHPIHVRDPAMVDAMHQRLRVGDVVSVTVLRTPRWPTFVSLAILGAGSRGAGRIVGLGAILAGVALLGGI